MIRLRRIDHVCLRVANVAEAVALWTTQFGLLSRGGDGGRALLSCDDEPYSLELVQAGDPGHDHTGFELARDCTLDEARGHLRTHGVSWQELECYLFAEMLICVKEKRVAVAQQWDENGMPRKVTRCTLKGSILIKKHLNEVTETGASEYHQQYAASH